MTKINIQNIEELSSKINDKKVTYIFEDDSLWLSKQDIAKIFKMDISDLTYYIHEYFFDSSFVVDSNIQNIYDEKTDNYISFLKLSFIISLWYKLKVFSWVKEIISLNRLIKNANLNISSLPTYNEANEEIIEEKMKAIDKAIDLINYLKSHDRLVYA